jgi:rhamnosyltransferase
MWKHWLSVMRQQRYLMSGLVVDSASSDGMEQCELPIGWKFLRIAEKDFNHGGTRNMALQYLPSGAELVVFMTQDVLLSCPDTLQVLLSAFDDPSVACAYGRQLPHTDATPLAAHARLFNYPTTSRTLSMADQPQLGIKTCFFSNSFAAYRLHDLLAVGGFPSDVILGKRVAYVAEACVHHSHNYTLAQEFRRYFDIGVFHARSSWLLQTFGEAGGEGLRFLLSETKYLLLRSPSWLFTATLHTFAKWMGYKLGRLEAYLPLHLKRLFSMHKGYWN